MSESPRLNRAELMRQIAALYARMAVGFREDGRPPLTYSERQEIVQQIVVLEKRLAD